jgi:hypothetical protein
MTDQNDYVVMLLLSLTSVMTLCVIDVVAYKLPENSPLLSSLLYFRILVHYYLENTDWIRVFLWIDVTVPSSIPR